MEEQLLDTWKIYNRINLYLLDAIADEALGIAATKGRSAQNKQIRICAMVPAKHSR